MNIDVTTYSRGGYHGDLNETFCVGNVDADGRRLVETAFECLQSALAMVKPGTLYRDLGSTIHRKAAAKKCSVVRTYCGHGIGSLFHTAPNVPVSLAEFCIVVVIPLVYLIVPNCFEFPWFCLQHYSKNKAKGVMKEGHVFTVEPMINLGSYDDITWDDNWTAVTRDGKRSAQFEHTVLVTKYGCEILTARENEPVMKWDPALLQR